MSLSSDGGDERTINLDFTFVDMDPHKSIVTEGSIDYKHCNRKRGEQKNKRKNSKLKGKTRPLTLITVLFY